MSLQKGQGYFYKRREKYKCTVFKVNMGVKGIHVCDKKGISVLFNMEKVGINYLFTTGLSIGEYVQLFSCSLPKSIPFPCRAKIHKQHKLINMQFVCTCFLKYKSPKCCTVQLSHVSLDDTSGILIYECS